MSSKHNLQRTPRIQSTPKNRLRFKTGQDLWRKISINRLSRGKGITINWNRISTCSRRICCNSLTTLTSMGNSLTTQTLWLSFKTQTLWHKNSKSTFRKLLRGRFWTSKNKMGKTSWRKMIYSQSFRISKRFRGFRITVWTKDKNYPICNNKTLNFTRTKMSQLTPYMRKKWLESKINQVRR